MGTTNDQAYAETAALFELLSQPARIQILLITREQPACVCHLVAALGLRQASISQHLMNLRKYGLVVTTREGRHIYYKIADPEILTLLELAAKVAGIPEETYRRLTQATEPVPGCPCPHCNPGQPPELDCKKP